jgi:NAD dependent epimerase/dehydratase family enzyme
MGSGRQWAPWIARIDALRMIERALDDDRWSGAINAVAPERATHAELVRAIARALGRPQWLSAPAWPIRLLLGEMSDLLLAGQDVRSARLPVLEFTFEAPRLEKALQRPRPRRLEPAVRPRPAIDPHSAALAGAVQSKVRRLG